MARSVPNRRRMMTATTPTPPVPQSLPVVQWLDLIRAEYREMPCLNLTKPQMQRLWGLEGHICDALVDALLAAGVLRRTTTGSYVAMTPGR